MKLKLKDVPEMPAGTKQNPNGSYDAIVDGFEYRWRFERKKLMLFIRYNPDRHKSTKENYVFPWKDIYSHPLYGG